MQTTLIFFFFFFNDTATTEIYTLSLHDALPICKLPPACGRLSVAAAGALSHNLGRGKSMAGLPDRIGRVMRSEEHTSELQSRQYLVCRLLLEKKKKKSTLYPHTS